MNWSNLREVKDYADDLAAMGFRMSVILRPKAVTFAVIHSVNEKQQVKKHDRVVYRTKEPKAS